MSRFIQEAFWQDEFIVGKSQVEKILHLIEDAERPVSEMEIAEFSVREVLQQDQEFLGARIYSPEQEYRAGERVVFIQERGARYAEVLQVVPAGGPSNEYGCYEIIFVRFKGDSSWTRYVSNCPRFPLRFSREVTTVAAEGASIEVITPGQLATRFREVILAEIRRALSDDGRFTYHDHRWYLVDDVVSINLDVVEQLLKNAGKPLLPEAILDEVFPGGRQARNEVVYLFSLNLALDTDTRRRFARVDREGRSCWMLVAAAPPRSSRYTVTEDALSRGYIEIRPGLRQMLIFYGLGSTLSFLVYGGYLIEGEVDEVTQRVYGADLASWYLENRVRPGDTVTIKAPEIGENALRLYTQDQEQIDDDPGAEAGQGSKRVDLRHRIYRLFLERGQFTHYKEVAERLSSAFGEEIRAESVLAVLSHAEHLFVRLGPSRGLWGLCEWLTASYDYRIDVTALLLDIGELQLVYRTLKENSRPMHAKELAEAIAGAYGVSPRVLIEANFIDAQDSRLLRLPSGEWGLIEWREQWRQELHQIDVELVRIEELSRTLHEHRLRLSETNYSIDRVRTLLDEERGYLSLLIEKHKKLVRDSEGIKEQIGVLEATHSELKRQEAHALIKMKKCLEVKQQQLSLAVCGGATSLVFWALGSLGFGGAIAALSLIPLSVARRVHSRRSNLHSLVSGLRFKRREVEYKAKELRGDLVSAAQNIQTGTQRLDTVRQELTEHEEDLTKLQETTRGIASAIQRTEQALVGYDKESLLAARDRLLKLLGDMPQ